MVFRIGPNADTLSFQPPFGKQKFRLADAEANSNIGARTNEETVELGIVSLCGSVLGSRCYTWMRISFHAL